MAQPAHFHVNDPFASASNFPGVVKSKVAGEVVNARLCRREASKGLVYVLTVLSRDGKVTHTTVDATSGKVVEAR